MQALNAARERCGMPQAYDEAAFLDLILQYNLHHNAVKHFLTE
jgi:hypothetical protein